MKELNRFVLREDGLTTEEIDLAKEHIRELCTFIKEENKRREEPNSDPEGWFTVRVNDETQKEELKNRLPSMFRNDINLLLKAGWLEESYNPLVNWEGLKQYRVDLVKIDKDVEEFCRYLFIVAMI
ncbi:hypothetical protein [Salipaludibacillus sp. CF4.18]|uniref:hypothetical protein n=1 Tax=Salipaludibacillus sp. CF4.18 TaxID=3373081 RepID=UPI003EE71E6E